MAKKRQKEKKKGDRAPTEVMDTDENQTGRDRKRHTHQHHQHSVPHTHLSTIAGRPCRAGNAAYQRKHTPDQTTKQPWHLDIVAHTEIIQSMLHPELACKRLTGGRGGGSALSQPPLGRDLSLEASADMKRSVPLYTTHTPTLTDSTTGNATRFTNDDTNE